MLESLDCWFVGFPLAFLGRFFFTPVSRKIAEKLTTPKI